MAAEVNVLIPFLQTLAGGLSAIGAVAVTQSWTSRRDNAKRRIELAEEMLALFYGVADAIRAIRNPTSWGGEGVTRPRNEHEVLSASESKLLDNAYVAIERYKKYEQLFNELKAKKYRFMAMFRGNSHEAFDDIASVMGKIFIAADMLGSHYWPRQGQPMEPDDFARHLKEKHEQQEIFWIMPDRDAISPLVDGAIRKIEAISDVAAKEYAGPPGWWSRWKSFAEGKSD